MVRPLRIEYPGAWYHVMNRGQGKRKIFLSDEDREAFLDLLGEASETFHIEIHAYTLLDNHYHLLVKTPKMGLSRAMRHINGVFTQKFNKAHRTDGPLFKGRYKAPLVDSDEYLLELVRYIHMNPVEAGLVKHPRYYSWSSHKYYLSCAKKPPWLVTDEVLGHFGRTEKAASRILNKFVCEGVSEETKKMFDKCSTIIGSSGFCDWVHNNFLENKKDDKEIRLSERRPFPEVNPKSILSDVAFAYNTTTADLRRSKPGRENEGRSVAVYLLRNLTGKSHKEIAKWVGVSNEYAIAKIYQRFKIKLKGSKRLRQKVEAISKANLSHVKT